MSVVEPQGDFQSRRGGGGGGGGWGVGGGGGGQKREFNVLKRLRVSDVLLIFLWKYEALAVWTSAEKDESKD